MRAGRLRERVVIQESTGGNPSASGERTDTWSTVMTRWAELIPQGGREFMAAQQVRNEMTHLVRMRYESTITPDMRLKLGSRYLYIIGIENVRERERELRLSCVEEV